MSSTLGIFAKLPVPGRVKTRLAARVGDVAALRLYEACLADVLGRSPVGDERLVVAYAPGDARAETEFRRRVHEAILLWPQPEGNLGVRLTAFFRTFLAVPGDRAIAIGTDSPTLPPAILRTALELLASTDCVLGPATDGGYYLVGLRRTDGVAAALATAATDEPASSPLLAEIDWGGPQVLFQTVANLQRAGLSLRMLPPWYDVDTLDDVIALRGHLRALATAGEPIPCPETARLLADWTSLLEPPRDD